MLPSAYQRLRDSAETLGMSYLSLAALCFGIGLRLIEMLAVNPVSPEIRDAYAARLEREMGEVKREAEELGIEDSLNLS